MDILVRFGEESEVWSRAIPLESETDFRDYVNGRSTIDKVSFTVRETGLTVRLRVTRGINQNGNQIHVLSTPRGARKRLKADVNGVATVIRHDKRRKVQSGTAWTWQSYTTLSLGITLSIHRS